MHSELWINPTHSPENFEIIDQHLLDIGVPYLQIKLCQYLISVRHRLKFFNHSLGSGTIRCRNLVTGGHGHDACLKRMMGRLVIIVALGQ